ncbi:MAG: nascent polypeptide-associated complex protein [Candidatus Bathyarchaeia archaeon]|nr:nascent polypeptide-associated complex protein [Candidatus Bathyarchaeota archaeon]
MRRLSPREAKRLLQRMGLNMTALEANEVVIKAKDKEIIIEEPEVAVLEVQGQKIFQITGGKITEKSIARRIQIPEEDVILVAQQANVSLEEARAALEQTGGDLAQAILLLTQK